MRLDSSRTIQLKIDEPKPVETGIAYEIVERSSFSRSQPASLKTVPIIGTGEEVK